MLVPKGFQFVLSWHTSKNECKFISVIFASQWVVWPLRTFLHNRVVWDCFWGFNTGCLGGWPFHVVTEKRFLKVFHASCWITPVSSMEKGSMVIWKHWLVANIYKHIYSTVPLVVCHFCLWDPYCLNVVQNFNPGNEESYISYTKHLITVK